MRVRADFNGLFGDVLCLSHGETCLGENGDLVVLLAGINVTAFEADIDDDGNPDDLIASGIVEVAPPWLQCNGSKWILRIDPDGVRHESDSLPERHSG